MRTTVELRSSSVRKRIVRRDGLERLARRICAGEGLRESAEINVLLCDDAGIAALNRQYAGKNTPTDVLSFEPLDSLAGAGPKPLGDIVISLETAERNCGGDRDLMRREVDLLFCHGLLHLLGYDHHTPRERAEMQRKQADYLGRTAESAWDFGPKTFPPAPSRAPTQHGGFRRFGRGQ